jgi:hypothetical protein
MMISPDIIFAGHIAVITSLLLSGFFIMTVKGNARPMVYMTVYRFAIAIVFIANIFQTYPTPYYGQLLWNPLHLLWALITYPLLFAYMFDLMRPGNIGLRYWLTTLVPVIGLAALHCVFAARNGALPPNMNR